MTNREGLPESSGPPLFGDLLKSYRQREHLSQRKAARMLGVDESTVAKLEAGSRKPPIHRSFYENLRDLPGMTRTEIGALLRTENAPLWLAAESDREEPAPKFNVARVGDIRAVITLESSTLPPEDLDDMREIIARTVTLTLRDVLRRKKQTHPPTNIPPQSTP